AGHRPGHPGPRARRCRASASAAGGASSRRADADPPTGLNSGAHYSHLTYRKCRLRAVLPAGGAMDFAASGRPFMTMPKIDLSSLPDLDTLTGLFGSFSQVSRPGHDDSIIIIAT